MLASELIKVAIERPYGEVYAFLAEPLNFTRWAANPDSVMEPLDGGYWLVDVPSGVRSIKFSPHNIFGVLDYHILPTATDPGHVTPVRLIANGAGCELLFVWMQQPGVTEERFASELEWIRSDLQRLKALLEAD